MTESKDLSGLEGIPPSLDRVSTTETGAELVQRIREMVRNTIILDINGMRSQSEINIGNLWGTTYEEGFVQKVSSGEISMAEILLRPDTPLTRPLSWPGFFRGEMNKGLRVLSEVLPESVNELITLSPLQLVKLLQLQEKEIDRRRFSTRRGGEDFNLYGKYFDRMQTLGIPEHGHFYPIEWGVLRRVILSEDSQSKLNEGVGILDLKPREGVKLGLSFATHIPHLFYQVAFEGNPRNNRGRVWQKLAILAYSPVVLEGWDEWFSEIKKNLIETPTLPENPDYLNQPS